MAFRKIGELIELGPTAIQNPDSVIPSIDPKIFDSMQKFAANLKRIAPKADDFLYFAAVMMHAAEHSLINDDGTPKLTRTGEKVDAHWDKTGGAWKWICNDPMIKPYKNSNCFIAGTKILMEDGSTKAIEDIQIGDKVITHTGKAKKVLELSKTDYTGKILEVKIKNNEPIYCTPEHPFYHVDFAGFAGHKKGLGRLTERKRNNESFRTSFKFSSINQLSVGDLLTSPVLHDRIDTPTLNPNKAKVLGIFAAEGSYSKRYDKRQGVRFTLGITETRIAQSIKEVFEEEFPECSVSIIPEPERSVISITATGSNIAEYFYYHTGEYSHEKRLSKELVFADDDIKKAFLSGYIDGDGCLTDCNKLVVISTSPHLAYQVRTMLSSMKIGSSIRKKDKCKRKITEGYKEYDCREHYRIEIYGDAYKKLELEKTTNKYKFDTTYNNKVFSNFEQDYHLHCVRSIAEQDFCGSVYNFEVEDDHSYVANGIVVHNCDIFPESELIVAHKKWVERPLCVDHKSNSVDHIRGIIVDTYYDRPLKRVIALCALDKKNYPTLADQVAKNLSTSVSMGTGVGRAICYDCGQVAKTADDFCHHMRNKTCYGEINVDLSPIELSIVVNGADPKAKIKHIIASADAINAYVATKEQELKKLGTTATLDSILKVKNDLSEAMNKLAELEQSLKDTEKSAADDTNDTAYNQTNSSIAMDESELPATELSLAPPTQRFASKELDDTVNKLALLKEAIQRQMEEVNNMSKELEKLSKNTKEETMSGKTEELNKQGYFQGGGGLNEPTPHQVKYPIDPMQGELREKEDKQMVGQSPFPEVGDIEGMHPSPESAETKDELERKKLIQRAEVEEREMRREAALLKAKAYFQGGGGVNEPTPGKQKYPVDKLEGYDRDKEDKQMVGQKPFPGVGDVEDLHPSPASVDQKDELKRKQMLQRASLKAKFVKAAKEDGLPDFAKSAWQVWEGDKLVLTATVDEISGGRTGALYNAIATETFAHDLMNKVRTYGAEKVASMFKTAQLQPPAPQMDAGPAPAMGDGAKGDGLDTSKEGDPKESLMDALEQTKSHLSDAEEAARALVGEQAEMGEMPELAAADDSEDSSKVSTAVLQDMRKEINTALTASLKEVAAELKAHEKELLDTVALYDSDLVNDKNRDFIQTASQEFIDNAQTSIKTARELLASFAVYCRGTELVVKRAEAEQAKQAKGTDMQNDTDLMALIDNAGKEIEAVAEANEVDALHAMLADDLKDFDMDTDEDSDEDSKELDSNCAVITNDPAKAADMAKMNPTVDVELKQASTKEDRAALRAKIASEMKWNPVFYEFHPKGKATTALDVKPEGDLGIVENLEENHDKIMDVAKAPPKVRKEAEEIQRLVAEGKLDPKTDLDILVANGVDPETVKYWKQFFGELGPSGSQFATELVKEHAKAQAEEELNVHRVKIARSYELAYDMVERGLLPREHQAISKQVDEFMKFNDEGFESYKKIIARHQPKFDKRAAVIPQVGLFEANETVQSLETEDLASQFASVFAKSPKRMF